MPKPLKIAALLGLAAFPLIEIGLLIRAGQVIGGWRLAAIVVLTAILGTYVIRRVGMWVFARALAGLERGRSGLEPLFDGFLQVLAGMLLILPGLITDAVGLLLLVPQVRQQIISSGLLKLVTIFHYQAEASRARFRDADTAPGDDDKPGPVIEGEFERLKEETVPQERSLRRRQG